MNPVEMDFFDTPGNTRSTAISERHSHVADGDTTAWSAVGP